MIIRRNILFTEYYLYIRFRKCSGIKYSGQDERYGYDDDGYMLSIFLIKKGEALR